MTGELKVGGSGSNSFDRTDADRSPICVHAIEINQAREYTLQLDTFHAQMFDTPFSAASLESLLSHDASRSFVATPDSNASEVITGVIIGRIAADEVEIVTVGVIPEFRRRGIAHGLLDALINTAASAGARSIFLEVNQHNEPAIALYRSYGFAQVGRRKGYYASAGGKKVDALVLALSLPNDWHRSFETEQ